MGTVIASLKSDEDRIVVQRNDRFESDGITFRTIFRRLNPNRVCNKQGEELVGQLGYTTQEVIDYINGQANLSPNISGGDGSGTDLIGESVCFHLDATSTSILMDSGQHFGVNTIKAIANSGNIDIVSIDTNDSITHFTNIEVGNACIDDTVVPGGLNDVIDALNELFTVGAFESVVIRDPFSTMIADVSGVDIVNPNYIGNSIDPVGNDVFASSSSNSLNGYLSDEFIDQAGEYFSFDIRVESIIGMGLVHTQDSYNDGYYVGSGTYANPTTFGTVNNQHYGFQFSHWFHPTPNGPWTNYGAGTSYVAGPGWSNVNKRFMSSDEGADWLAGNPVKMRVGLDANGFISIDYYDVSEAEWIVCARTSYSMQEGTKLRLGIKMGSTTSRLYSLPKVHLLEPAAPTMYFRYAESPDGVFKSPLFATSEEAEYYDTVKGGSGTYTTLMLPDDPTNTLWYVPDTEYTGNGIAAPSGNTFQGNNVNWTEITTLTNADLVPPAFTDTTITVDELSAVNYQVSPQDVGYITTIGGIPAWSIPDGHTLQGTAPEVTGDNATNPSDTTTVTIYRTNSYGTSQGTLTIIINNLTAPVITPITGFTHNASSTTLVDSNTMDDGSVVTMDEDVKDLERLVILKSFVETNVLPSLQQPGDKYYMGVLNSGADVSSVEDADWDVAFVWEYQTATTHKYRVIKDGTQVHSVGIGSNTVALFDYAIEVHNGHVYMIACNQNSINTEPSPEYGGSFSNAHEVLLGESTPLTISLAYVGSGNADFSESGLSEIVTPIPDDWIQITGNPSHILNFDGSGSMPTLQAGYTYRFLMGDTVYADLSTNSGLHIDDDLRFTADGSTEYTTGITRVGNPNDLNTFGVHTAYVEFTVPSDVPPLQWYTDHNGIGTATGINISGSSYVAPVTGITLEGSNGSQTSPNLFDTGSYGWASIDESLSAGERLVMNGTFLNDLASAMPNNSGVYIGIKDTTFGTGNNLSSFEGYIALYIAKYSSSNVQVRVALNGALGSSSSTYYTSVTGLLSWRAFIEITNLGNNIRIAFSSSSSNNAENTAYADWSAVKVQTGDQGYGITSRDIMIFGEGTYFGNSSGMSTADVDWTELSEVNVPSPAVTNLTNWTKALDFSGSSERAVQVNQNTTYNALRMNGLSATVGSNATANYTTSFSTGRPWATAIVFKSDFNSSNQHIWNSGEGAGNADDNIYLRTDSNGILYFGWGRSSALNECRLGGQAITGWRGVYIASTGERLSGSNATAANLADAFDIRVLNEVSNWVVPSNLSTTANWISTGGRMDRSILGDFTIGGRGANRNFHGKVASMVITTLKLNSPMPTNAEIELMITDPKKWEDDYLVGNTIRQSHYTTNATYSPSNIYNGFGAVQIWLMGDGVNDSYSNMIRNQVFPSDQNYTKLNLLSMVSNDIQNVSINGLS